VADSIQAPLRYIILILTGLNRPAEGTESKASRMSQLNTESTESTAETGVSPRHWVPAYKTRIGKRAELNRKQRELVNGAPTLATKFPSLKSLNVRLYYLAHPGASHTSEVKYAVNVLHAKSIFAFGCQNPECFGGDFDLSDLLASAIHSRKRKTTGEMACVGRKGTKSLEDAPCGRALRFELTMAFC